MADTNQLIIQLGYVILIQMNILQAIILGAVQGLTEFLPVSSSGHLVLAEVFMNLSIPERDLLGFDILLHAGTALALLLAYRQIWWRLSTAWARPDPQHRRLLFFIILATIPGAAAGLLADDFIAANLRSPATVAAAFLITAVLLVFGSLVRGKTELSAIRLRHVVAMGLAQACALVPGLSRSGLTISFGQMTGLKRSDSLDFSFLMAMPIILGATVVTLKDVIGGDIQLPPLTVSVTGFLSSFFVSLITVWGLRRFVARHSLGWFAIYLVPVAGLLLWHTLAN